MSGGRFTVLYSESAHRDIQAIHRYISVNLESPLSANRIIKKILQTADSLNLFPNASEVKLSRHNLKFRIIHAANFSIIYTVDNRRKTVRIRHIYYSRRDIESLLS